MAATVKKLFDHLISVTPKTPLLNIADELPFDSTLRSEAIKCMEAKDFKGYLSIMGQCLPKQADKVYENIYIGGKKQVEVIHVELSN